jgi:hypothetical protein
MVKRPVQRFAWRHWLAPSGAISKYSTYEKEYKEVQNYAKGRYVEDCCHYPGPKPGTQVPDANHSGPRCEPESQPIAATRIKWRIGLPGNDQPCGEQEEREQECSGRKQNRLS